MTFREFVNLDRTDEPVLSNEKFRAVLAAARMWFESHQPKRRRGGRRGHSVVPVEPVFEDAPAFDIIEELR